MGIFCRRKGLIEALTYGGLTSRTDLLLSRSHTGRLPESRRSISDGECGLKLMTGAPAEHTADDEEIPVADVRPGDTNNSALGGEAGGRARTSSVGGGNTA